jgi:DNA repair exonuclease SbcCD ATPase subunit
VPVNLKRIYIRNFETIKEATIDFPTSGLCLVIGQNKTKSSVESIGAGKTALGEAISRTLLGVRGRYKGAKLGAYSADHCGNKDTLIKLECEMDGKSLIVWSSYRCKEFSATGESLRFQFDGAKAIERGNIDQTRDELNRLIGVSSEVAESTVFVDGVRLNFNDMSETELVELFLASLSRTNWEAAQKRVKATLDSTEDEQNVVAGKVEVAKNSLADVENDLSVTQKSLPIVAKQIEEQKKARQARVATSAKKVEDAKAAVAKTKAKMQEIKDKLKKLEATKAEEFAKNELEVSRLRSQLAEHNRQLETANRDVGSAKKDLATAKQAKQALEEPANCPTCGKPWDRQHSEAATAAADAEIVSKNKIFVKAQKNLVEITSERDFVDNQIEDLREKNRRGKTSEQISDLSEDYEKEENQLEDDVDELKSCERQLSTDNSPVDETQLAVLSQKIKDDEKKVLKKQAELDGYEVKNVELSTTVAVLKYWHKAFGPTGLPNMILGDAMGFINHVSHNLSSILTGGLLSIDYSNTKTLANNSERPELMINVQNETGAKKFVGSSKGEAGISNLIIAETLNEIGRVWHRVGYRWLDEAVNSQDKMIRGAVYSYMREQARARSILTFVVDHNQDVESFADHVLVAEKSTEGFTTYRWETVVT